MVAVALQIALSFGLALNLVVCRGTGGHVAVESALSDCCTGHAPGGPEQGSAQLVAADSDCDGCTDTPLLQTAIQRERGSKDTLTRGPRLLLVATRLTSLRPAPSVFVTRDTHGAPPAPLASVRRSVVLVV